MVLSDERQPQQEEGVGRRERRAVKRGGDEAACAQVELAGERPELHVAAVDHLGRPRDREAGAAVGERALALAALDKDCAGCLEEQLAAQDRRVARGRREAAPAAQRAHGDHAQQPVYLSLIHI